MQVCQLKGGASQKARDSLQVLATCADDQASVKDTDSAKACLPSGSAMRLSERCMSELTSVAGGRPELATEAFTSFAALHASCEVQTSRDSCVGHTAPAAQRAASGALRQLQSLTTATGVNVGVSAGGSGGSADGSATSTTSTGGLTRCTVLSWPRRTMEPRHLA